METTNRNILAGGVYAALATPRRPGLAEPDAAAFLDYLETVVRVGVDGIVLFGSTGEFVHFDVADRMHTLSLAIKRSRVPVLVNVSHSTLDGACALADDAIELGAAGLLLMPPYFYRYGEEEIEAFYAAFMNTIAGRSPVYLYNLPQFTNPVSPALAAKLLGSGLYAGIKDSSGDWDMFQALRRLKDAHSFRLMVGNERLYLRAAHLEGADGIVSGIAAAIPELLVGIDRALRGNNGGKARRLDEYLQEFLNRIEMLPPTFGIKQAAALRGWLADSVAVPLGPKLAAEAAAYGDWFKQWISSAVQECVRA